MIREYRVKAAAFVILNEEVTETYESAIESTFYQDDANQQARIQGIFCLEALLGGKFTEEEEAEGVALLDMALRCTAEEARAIEVLLSMGAKPAQLLEWLCKW